MVTSKDQIIKVMFAGSVDDGKSTLLGHMLCDMGTVKDDVLDSIARDSKDYDGVFNYALVADGLKAEREQGITIEVAHLFCDTDIGRLHIYDCPGHEEYTGNMAVAASQADIAVVLLDVFRGPTLQTFRHLDIIRMLRVPRIIIAVNKCDLIGWEKTRADYELDSIRRWEEETHTPLDYVFISAKTGNNIASLKKAIAEAYKAIQEEEATDAIPAYIVEGVTVRDSSRRYRIRSVAPSKQLSSYIPKKVTNVRTKMEVSVLPVSLDIELPPGEMVVELGSEVDMEVGDLLTEKEYTTTSDTAQATLFWLDREPFSKERSYIMQGTLTPTGKQFFVDDDISLERFEATGVHITTEIELPKSFTYENSKELGSYLVIDAGSYKTVGFLSIR